jgi:ubiquinone/menaquinone biosynthesis C-methylase UbiE
MMIDTTADARFWDRAARKYAASPIKDMVGYERTVERTRGLLKPTDKVLEIGCGTGTTALKLAPGVESILGTDVSPGMVEIAREKAATEGRTNATFEVAAAHALPSADGVFDAVLGFNILHLLADRATMLHEVRRVLRPGGIFISKTPCLSEMNVLIRLVVPVMRRIGLAPTVTIFSGEELESAVTSQGFDIEARERHGSGRKDARLFLVARVAGG